MKKILRLSLVAIVTLICNVAFADAYKTLTFPDETAQTTKLVHTQTHGQPKLVMILGL